MDDARLAEAIHKMRAFAVTNGMQWVLDEVDEAISLGIPEVRELRQSTRQGQTTYEDVTSWTVDASRATSGATPTGRRVEKFVRRRPMTSLEQATLLVEALRNVLVGLDDVAEGALSALNSQGSLAEEVSKTADPSSSHMPMVQSISFAPDEGSSSPAIDINRRRDSQRFELVTDVLDQIEIAINS
jgi:hypothetical protein